MVLGGTSMLAASLLLAQADQPDYRSKVPRYTSADTLEEHEEQLKISPIM